MKYEIVRELTVGFKNTRKKILTGECVFNPEDSFKLAKKLQQTWHNEIATCLFFDIKNKLIGFRHVGVGTNKLCVVNTRDLILSAVGCNAAGVVFYHNHPSGNLEPSKEDDRMAGVLSMLCGLHDIELLDVLIISEDSFYSYMAQGSLSNIKNNAKTMLNGLGEV